MFANEFEESAIELGRIIEEFDRSKPLLQEAYTILRPILDDALAGILRTPGQLPNRTFFFGMYEHSLPAHYLRNVALMNALARFDEAWQHARSHGIAAGPREK
jgi:hypothetical protein